MALTKVQTIGIETGISLTGVTTVTTLNASTDTLSVGGTVNFGGNVSIAGTLTYEDVTNIDSVGIITARNGIKVNDLGVQVGTGATVDSAAANTLTFLTNGSERVRITSAGLVGIGTVSPSGPIHVHAASGTQRSYFEASAAHSFLRLKSGSTSYNSGLEFFSGASNIANINGLGAGGLQFEVNGSEAARFDSSGNFGLDTTNPQAPFVVSNSGAQGVEIGYSGGSSSNYVQAYNRSSSAFIQLDVIGNPLLFKSGSSATERARIDSSGRLLVNHTADTAPNSYLSKIQLCDTSYPGSSLSIRRDGDSSSGPVLLFAKSRSTSKGGNTVIQDGDSIGALYYYGADGTDADTLAGEIAVQVDGTPGSNDIPSRMVFATNAGASDRTERMRLDSGGRLLVGTTSSSGNFRAVFQGNAGNSAAGGDVVLARGAATPANAQALGLLGFSDNTHTVSAVIQCNRDSGTWSSSSKPTLMAFQTCADSSSTPTERMRITKDGHLRFGQSSSDTPGYGNSTTGISMLPDGRIFSSMGGTFSQWNRNSNGSVISFARSSTGVGQISVTTSATSYGTSSDYRLKENVVALDGAIARVKQLLPKRFNFIVDADTTVDGFLAHEAQTVVPEAVTGTHNEVDDDGNAVMQGIDTSKLVPLLTAALQEAIAKIETLETKVAALEG